MENKNEIAIIDESIDIVTENSRRFENMDISADLEGGKTGYCTMTAADNKARVTLYNATQNAEKLSTMINVPIKLLHVYAEVIQINRKDAKGNPTGEIISAPRVVLIDETGKGFYSVGSGIYDNVKRIFAMFGHPGTWEKPHTVVCTNVDLGNGKHTYNLDVLD